MNSSRYHLERELGAFAAGLPSGARVLDAGAGDCCYRVHFEGCAYESQDFAQVDGKTYGTLDHVCDIRDMPIEDARFDAAICTQVLAHIPDPGAALSELFRVVRPGGKLLLTAPLFFQENEPPHDHFRYTRWGLEGLFERAGFQVEALRWLEGYAGTVSYQLGMAYRRLPRRPRDFGGGGLGLGCAGLVALTRPVLGLLSVALGKADTHHRYVEGGMCKNYLVIATRTEGAKRD